RFDTVGSTLTIFINGAQAISVSDTALSTGTAGVRTGQGATIDNFSAQIASGATSFNDNFSSGLGANCQLRPGQFSAQGSALSATGATANLATVVNGTLTNASVQADISLGGGQWAGLVARYADANDMYFANWFIDNGTYYMGIFKCVGGT